MTLDPKNAGDFATVSMRIADELHKILGDKIAEACDDDHIRMLLVELTVADMLARVLVSTLAEDRALVEQRMIAAAHDLVGIELRGQTPGGVH